MKVTAADKWFSYYIRLRDSDENGMCKCVTCSTRKLWKNMHCGHYVKRQHSGTRYSEYNCHAQCQECNWLKQGNDAVYKEFIISTYGQQTHDLLKSAEHKAFKQSAMDIKILTQEYKQKATELAKKKRVKL